MQLMVFHAPRDTFFYLMQDLAFVPLQVIMVTLVLDQILSSREKRDKLKKINVVISAFYTETGTAALTEMSSFLCNLEELKECLNIKPEWEDNDFKTAVKIASSFEYDIDSREGDLSVLKEFLRSKSLYMLGMFENPNLLEHDTFTDMLWAVFHVIDELDSRDSLQNLPQNDLHHLSGDIKRAYMLLLIEWLYYMNHLKNEYPYLFSLAVRKNPFAYGREVIFR
ncbi:MAG TPA: hypothetical protein VF941_08575 [Clostridia bacterium]